MLLDPHLLDPGRRPADLGHGHVDGHLPIHPDLVKSLLHDGLVTVSELSDGVIASRLEPVQVALNARPIGGCQVVSFEGLGVRAVPAVVVLADNLEASVQIDVERARGLLFEGVG